MLTFTEMRLTSVASECTLRMAGLLENHGSLTSSSIVTDGGNVLPGTNRISPSDLKLKNPASDSIQQRTCPA